jgi:hypothetical protein
MKYKSHELEKQKLQNAVCEVSEMAYVKYIGDQDIAKVDPPLVYKMYMDLLLSACST